MLRRAHGRLVLAAVALAAAGAALAAGAGRAETAVPPVAIDVTAPPARLLSAYHLFADPTAQVPNAGVMPYDITTPLFSDYAAKHRFVWLPPGASVAYDTDGALDFPVGTVLVKTFAMPFDQRAPEKGERLLETRLLLHKPGGWTGLPYIWNDAQTDAELSIAGGMIDVGWIHFDGEPRSNTHIVPNINQCKGCHENAKVLGPIGPKVRNLNKPFAYPDGPENQLVRWTEAGILRGAPADPDAAPRLPVWNDPATGSLNDRARAYLETNCAHCHNPDGPANTSGLDLRYDQREPMRYGVMKPPVAAGRGSGGLRFDIVPGRPDESIMVFRMAGTEPDVMMPELGRLMVHDEGVQLIREWIAAMPPWDKSATWSPVP